LNLGENAKTVMIGFYKAIKYLRKSKKLKVIYGKQAVYEISEEVERIKKEIMNRYKLR